MIRTRPEILSDAPASSEDLLLFPRLRLSLLIAVLLQSPAIGLLGIAGWSWY